MSNPTDDSPTTAEAVEVSTEKTVIFGIGIDITYCKSPKGLLRAGEIILSIVSFICVAASRIEVCDLLHGGGYRFFEFVSMSAFLSALIMYIIFIVDIQAKFFLKFVPWHLADVIWGAVWAIFYFIASTVVAANTCFQDGNKAGAVFGFFALIVFGADGVISFLKVREERMSAASHQTSKAAELPGQKLEQY